MAKRKSIKLSEFVQILVRLDTRDVVPSCISGGVNVAKIAEIIMGDHWMDKLRDNGDTEELRHQLKFLRKTGRFDFSEFDEENIPYKPTFVAKFSRN